MSKSTKKPAKSPLSGRAAKAAHKSADEPKTNKTDARSKQARVIAMLQSPTGTRLILKMEAPMPWGRHAGQIAKQMF
jgi:hypothetical protein